MLAGSFMEEVTFELVYWGEWAIACLAQPWWGRMLGDKSEWIYGRGVGWVESPGM